jgi:hypothetical protein
VIPSLSAFERNTVPYTAPQNGELRHLTNEYHRTGKPEIAYRLETEMSNDVAYDELVAKYGLLVPKPNKEVFKPETDIAQHLVDIPPRAGKGSGRVPWKEFAMLTTDIETDVLELMSRDELIRVLEERGVIQPNYAEDE